MPIIDFNSLIIGYVFGLIMYNLIFDILDFENNQS
jgi:hypothetical protein